MTQFFVVVIFFQHAFLIVHFHFIPTATLYVCVAEDIENFGHAINSIENDLLHKTNKS